MSRKAEAELEVASYLDNMSIKHILSNKRPSKNEGEAWEEAMKIVNATLYTLKAKRGKRETYNKAASPTRLTCLPQSAGADLVETG